ncbi:MAG: RNA polymerase sigma factor [Pirellulaceae bacterium]
MVDTAPSGSDSTRPAAGQPAIATLVAEHYRALFAYAYRLTGSQSDAEDLTQQAFLIAQTRLYQLREREKANRWLFAILRSCFLKSVGRPRMVSLESAEIDVADEHHLADDDCWIDPEQLQRALHELSAEYRIVVLMFYFEDLAYKEIAEQLEVPIGTVMSRLARAKASLRQRLADDEPDDAAREERRANPRVVRDKSRKRKAGHESG